MTAKEPVAEETITADRPTPAPWVEARERLEKAEKYWLATEHPDGGPHLRPVLAVWVDGALHFASSPTTRKGKNLANDSRCVVSAACEDLDLVVEGMANKVRDDGKLRRVAEIYLSKYGWPVTVRDGAFYAEGAPTAGSAPYEVYEVTPTTVFGFPTTDKFGPTRWRF